MTFCAPRIPAEFVGRSMQDLQAELVASQRALSELKRGAKLVTATYAQGDGNKSLTFKEADMGALQAQVVALAAIVYPGQGYGRRRPLRMLYR